MPTVTHSEVLAHDWLPPTAFGRAREVEELVLRLDPPRPHAPGPWTVAVGGPPGCGASTVARRAAREVMEQVRAALGEPLPRTIALRTPFLRGAHGVATALVQQLDEGFDGRGFPVPEILAGFLRRLRRERRPTVILLDDLAPGGPDLTPILRAFGDPDRFLPEGESGLPPLWTILAGVPEALDALEVGLGGRVSMGPLVRLEPYDPATLRSIVADRAQRALGHEAPSPMIERVVRRTVEDGGGARRAVDLLRRELLGMTFRGVPDGLRPSRLGGIPIEPWVVRAIGLASRGKAARLAEVRRIEAELAGVEGVRSLPTTTLWRRIVRLERAGYVRREIRPGGPGGTLSVLRVLTPIEDWVTTAHRSEIRRADGPSSSTDVPPAGVGAVCLRAALGRLPDGPGAGS
ncbi:MAG TPA: AAA family ATPase [Thermoplasmata archaeon]|nr:AAA family ATPase [Thermoplasmata archaeon]